MGVQLQIFDHTYKAGADLSAKQFYGVKFSAAETVNVGTAATDTLIGVLQNKPDATGKAADVRHFGLSKGAAGGTIAAGDPVTVDAAGKLVKAAPAAGTNNGVVGWAVEAATNGDVFTVLMMPHRIQG